MLQSKNESGGLLSSRLQNKTAQQPGQIRVEQMRPKEARDSAVPTYGIAEEKNQPKKTENKAKQPLLHKETQKSSYLHDKYEDMESAEDFDKELDFEDFQRIKKQTQRSVLSAKLSKVFLALILILCVYVAFLIYGVIQTNYVYNDAGAVEPEVLSVAQLDELNQYNELSSYYLRIRILYEDVLKLDYTLATNAEDSQVLAREYLSLLDDVSKLATDINAIQMDTGYQGIINRMYEFVYTHTAVYLQNMNGALEGEDSEKANQALLGRESIESEFTTLTQNMVSLYQSTKGAKNGEIYEWSPASYTASLGGVTLE